MVAINRMQRIAEQLRHELGKILLREVNDRRLKYTSITDIKVAKDMSHATVFFIIAQQTHQAMEIEQTLNKAAHFMRKCLAAEINLPVTPKLRFIYDNSLESGRRLVALIDQAIVADKQRVQQEEE